MKLYEIQRKLKHDFCGTKYYYKEISFPNLRKLNFIVQNNRTTLNEDDI